MKIGVFFMFLFIFPFLALSQAKPKKPVKTTVNKSKQTDIEEDDKDVSDKEVLKILEDFKKNSHLKNLPINEEMIQQARKSTMPNKREKESAQIALIRSSPLTKSDLPVFLKTIYSKLKAIADPSLITVLEPIYNDLQNSYDNAQERGSQVAGLMTIGRGDAALMLTSRLCAEDQLNDNNINNLAALLTLFGAEHRAIPLLNYLLVKYPKNSTVLNNLGQAWYGLGDDTKAFDYFNRCIAVAPYHSEANYTEGCYYEAKGEKIKAVEAFKKSIKTNYTSEKAHKLKRLDYDASKDAPPLKPPYEFVKKIQLPDAPESCKEGPESWAMVWEPFIASLQDEMDRNQEICEQSDYFKEKDDDGNSRSEIFKKKIPAYFAIPAILELMARKWEAFLYSTELFYKKAAEIGAKMRALEQDMDYGKNIEYRSLVLELSERTRRHVSEYLDVMIYYCPETDFPALKAWQMNMYLSSLTNGQHLAFGKCPPDKERNDEQKGPKPLLDYDETNGFQGEVFNYFGFGTIQVVGNKLLVTMGTKSFENLLPPGMKGSVNLNVEQDMRREGFFNSVNRGTLEVSAGVGKSIDIGGVTAEISAVETGTIIYDREKGTSTKLGYKAGVEVGVEKGPAKVSGSAELSGSVEFNENGAVSSTENSAIIGAKAEGNALGITHESTTFEGQKSFNTKQTFSINSGDHSNGNIRMKNL